MPTDHPIPLDNAILTRFFTTVVFPELGGPSTMTRGPLDEPFPFEVDRCRFANIRFRSSERWR